MKEKGIVLKSTGSLYIVKPEDSPRITCSLKGNFRIKGIKSTNPVAVGDYVVVEIQEQHEIAIITEISDRKNCIIRQATNLSKRKHLIAANIDCVYIIVSLKQPCIPLGFIDRYLVAAESYFIPAKIIFNKIDMYDKKAEILLNQYKEIYSSIGYSCLETSAVKGDGIAELKEMLKGKVNLFSGQSGVGKSTLINRLQPELDLKTASVSTFNEKGKHATTYAEMFETEDGYIIDTPGLRGFELIDFTKDEISLFFPEMKALSPQCHFYNCTHTHEPDCAIKLALEKSEIAQSRYMNYLMMLESHQENYKKNK